MGEPDHKGLYPFVPTFIAVKLVYLHKPIQFKLGLLATKIGNCL